jgi:hypothetical protein
MKEGITRQQYKKCKWPQTLEEEKEEEEEEKLERGALDV